MKNKNKYSLVIAVLLVVLLSVGGYATYARYVANAGGTKSVDIAKWNLVINNETITSSAKKVITTSIVWDENNNNVASGKFAPGMTGDALLVVNPTGTEVAFDFYVSASANAAFDNDNITIGTLSAGMCKNGTAGQYTNQTDCEAAGTTGDWTSIALSLQGTGATHEGYYKGSVSLPTVEGKLSAMTASQSVIIDSNILWTDSNTSQTNEDDTSTGISDPTDAEVQFDVIVEQKVN